MMLQNGRSLVISETASGGEAFFHPHVNIRPGLRACTPITVSLHIAQKNDSHWSLGEWLQRQAWQGMLTEILVSFRLSLSGSTEREKRGE